MSTPTPRRPMTPLERELAVALGGCSFSVGTWDKRFARDMRAAAVTHQTITEGQAEWLPKMVHRYRRQLSAATVAMAGALMADPREACGTGSDTGATESVGE